MTNDELRCDTLDTTQGESLRGPWLLSPCDHILYLHKETIRMDRLRLSHRNGCFDVCQNSVINLNKPLPPHNCNSLLPSLGYKITFQLLSFYRHVSQNKVVVQKVHNNVIQ